MPEAALDDFYAMALKIARKLELGAKSKTLRGFGIVILDEKEGTSIKFGCDNYGLQISLLGGLGLLTHGVIVDTESHAMDDETEQDLANFDGKPN